MRITPLSEITRQATNQARLTISQRRKTRTTSLVTTVTRKVIASKAAPIAKKSKNLGAVFPNLLSVSEAYIQELKGLDGIKRVPYIRYLVGF